MSSDMPERLKRQERWSLLRSPSPALLKMSSLSSILTLKFYGDDSLARESDVAVSTNVTPQAEYKGFATYVVSFLCCTLWLLWSTLPDSVLHSLNIYYYPSRWWALAVPSYILMSMIYVYVALALYNIERETVPLNSLSTITDSSAVLVNEKMKDLHLFKSTSGVWDLPIVDVNDVLYGGDDDGGNDI